MKFGQKCGGQNRKIGLTFFPPKCSKFFFHKKVGYYPPNKKFFDNFAITCDFEDQKAIFLKKCIFWPENDVFANNSVTQTYMVW